MNPEAVEWLESLDEKERWQHFTPGVGDALMGNLFSIKEDHEYNHLMCRNEEL